uniref:Uncharacterized protein n=1 Tax=Rhizophora mucronata TaxID=61149 RepID=A0A2P2PGN3_RHIMU
MAVSSSVGGLACVFD